MHRESHSRVEPQGRPFVILHKLVYRYLKYGDDSGFYLLQALDSVRWLERSGIELGSGTTVLDLGCGHGMIGGELAKKGCRVTFADIKNSLLPEYEGADYREFDVESDDYATLGAYDLVICSNMLEHIPRPANLISKVDRLLNPGGLLYLSWVNWLSPWGGHEFTPFHYLGPRYGHRVYDRVVGRPRNHTPYLTLFPTSISGTLRMIRGNQRLRIKRILPRYTPELSFVAHIPLLREFLAMNCLVIIEKCDRDNRW